MTSGEELRCGREDKSAQEKRLLKVDQRPQALSVYSLPEHIDFFRLGLGRVAVLLGVVSSRLLNTEEMRIASFMSTDTLHGTSAHCTSINDMRDF